jgi:dTDP-4-amino-4,6-dideoxygalactose transaminase
MQGILSGDYPIADEQHATELSLPISVGHTRDEIERVCDAVQRFKA